jgi:hypothetical protein
MDLAMDQSPASTSAAPSPGGENVTAAAGGFPKEGLGEQEEAVAVTAAAGTGEAAVLVDGSKSRQLQQLPADLHAAMMRFARQVVSWLSLHHQALATPPAGPVSHISSTHTQREDALVLAAAALAAAEMQKHQEPTPSTQQHQSHAWQGKEVLLPWLEHGPAQQQQQQQQHPATLAEPCLDHPDHHSQGARPHAEGVSAAAALVLSLKQQDLQLRGASRLSRVTEREHAAAPTPVMTAAAGDPDILDKQEVPGNEWEQGGIKQEEAQAEPDLARTGSSAAATQCIAGGAVGWQQRLLGQQQTLGRTLLSQLQSQRRMQDVVPQMHQTPNTCLNDINSLLSHFVQWSCQPQQEQQFQDPNLQHYHTLHQQHTLLQMPMQAGGQQQQLVRHSSPAAAAAIVQQARAQDLLLAMQRRHQQAALLQPAASQSYSDYTAQQGPDSRQRSTKRKVASLLTYDGAGLEYAAHRPAYTAGRPLATNSHALPEQLDEKSASRCNSAPAGLLPAPPVVFAPDVAAASPAAGEAMTACRA